MYNLLTEQLGCQKCPEVSAVWSTYLHNCTIRQPFALCAANFKTPRLQACNPSNKLATHWQACIFPRLPSMVNFFTPLPEALCQLTLLCPSAPCKACFLCSNTGRNVSAGECGKRLWWLCVVQPQVDFVAAMTASRAAILPLDPYIAAEAGEGVAYRALPTPKASVLNAVSTTVSDLNTRFERVLSHCWSHSQHLPCKHEQSMLVPMAASAIR